MRETENNLKIIIVTWNNAQTILSCLDTLSNEKKQLLSNVIIIDNHSSDDTVNQVKNNYPNVTLVENKNNLGFSSAVNQGLKSGISDYYLVLNPDTSLDPSSIIELVDYMNTNHRIGIIGPRIVDTEGIPELSFGKFPGIWNEFVHRRRFYKLQNRDEKIVRWLNQDIHIPMAVDWVSGACMLFRHDVVLQNGYFDENYFMYFEDIDYSFRARDAGWEVIYYPLVSVTHLRGHSSRQNHKTVMQEYRKSQNHFYIKYKNLFSRVLLSLYQSVKKD